MVLSLRRKLAVRALDALRSSPRKRDRDVVSFLSIKQLASLAKLASLFRLGPRIVGHLGRAEQFREAGFRKAWTLAHISRPPSLLCFREPEARKTPTWREEARERKVGTEPQTKTTRPRYYFWSGGKDQCKVSAFVSMPACTLPLRAALAGSASPRTEPAALCDASLAATHLTCLPPRDLGFLGFTLRAPAAEHCMAAGSRIRLVQSNGRC
jgi:hypothetical protein